MLILFAKINLSKKEINHVFNELIKFLPKADFIPSLSIKNLRYFITNRFELLSKENLNQMFNFSVSSTGEAMLDLTKSTLICLNKNNFKLPELKISHILEDSEENEFQKTNSLSNRNLLKLIKLYKYFDGIKKNQIKENINNALKSKFNGELYYKAVTVSYTHLTLPTKA